MKFINHFSFLFLALVLADQVTKQAFVWEPGCFEGSWLGSLICIIPFRNYYFAFSLPLPFWVMYGIYALILVGMFLYLYQFWNSFPWYQKQAWVLIVAGAVSNIGERIIFGYVQDFIYIYGGAIINLADVYIIMGLLSLLFYHMLENRK